MVKNISSLEQGFITYFLLLFLIFNRIVFCQLQLNAYDSLQGFFDNKRQDFSCIRSWLLMKNDKLLLYDREINSNQLVHIHLLCFVCNNNLNLSGLITNGINSLTDLSLMFLSQKKHVYYKTYIFFYQIFHNDENKKVV